MSLLSLVDVNKQNKNIKNGKLKLKLTYYLECFNVKHLWGYKPDLFEVLL